MSTYRKSRFIAMFAFGLVLPSGLAAANAPTYTHVATGTGIYVEVRNASDDILCAGYPPAGSDVPVADNCPAGEALIEFLFDSGWNDARTTVNVPAAVAPPALYTHVATQDGIYVELRNDDEVILCAGYPPAGSTRPVADGCPEGQGLTELVFDDNWNDQRATVDVPMATEPDPSVPDSSTTGLYSHVATADGIYVELRNDDEDILCAGYPPAGSTRAVADNCPQGVWTELVFADDWTDARTTVNVPSLTDGDDENNADENNADESNEDESNEDESNEDEDESTEPTPVSFAPVRNTHPSFDLGSDVELLDVDDDDFTTYLGPIRDCGAAVCPEDWDSGDAAEPGALRLGNFRVSCQYSHFSYDDPIVHPGEPGYPRINGEMGKGHLHMFFGNTETDAYTSADVNDPNFVGASGGGTCNGFALNRSAYWMPALTDSKGYAIVPFQIIAYYKTYEVAGDHLPEDVVDMPQGLQLIAGNTVHADDNFGEKGRPDRYESELLFWSCGYNGEKVPGSKQSTIPDCGDQPINATIYFPQCWDGEHLQPYDSDGDGEPDTTHVRQVLVGEPCPEGYEARLPQLGILTYFAPQDTTGWQLSSDKHHGAAPGTTLHADWFGGWNDDLMADWVDECIHAEKNCTFGQTGTSRTLNRLDQGPGYQDDEYGRKSDDYQKGSGTYTGDFGDLNQYLVPISEVDYPGKE